MDKVRERLQSRRLYLRLGGGRLVKYINYGEQSTLEERLFEQAADIEERCWDEEELEFRLGTRSEIQMEIHKDRALCIINLPDEQTGDQL